MTTWFKDSHVRIVDAELILSLVGIVPILDHAGILGILNGLISITAIAPVIVVVEACTVN